MTVAGGRAVAGGGGSHFCQLLVAPLLTVASGDSAGSIVVEDATNPHPSTPARGAAMGFSGGQGEGSHRGSFTGELDLFDGGRHDC